MEFCETEKQGIWVSILVGDSSGDIFVQKSLTWKGRHTIKNISSSNHVRRKLSCDETGIYLKLSRNSGRKKKKSHINKIEKNKIYLIYTRIDI